MLFASQQSSLGMPSEIEVTDSPSDTISSLSFMQTSNILAATSWDNSVRLYEVADTTGQSIKKLQFNNEKPVLCGGFSSNGQLFSTGDTANTVKVYDLNTSQCTTVGIHEQPVSCLSFANSPTSANLLVTGSWDKTLKYWDLRSNQPAFSYQLPDKCYGLDVCYPLMVVASGNSDILTFDLNNPTKAYSQIKSELKQQTRDVLCFPTKTAFAYSCIFGRVAIQSLDKSAASKESFTFKCHRTGSNVYPVNKLAAHPTLGVFATAGSDGTIVFWDRINRKRLSSIQKHSGSYITALKYNTQGTMIAYATGYDWSKGYNPDETAKAGIFIHKLVEDDIRKK